MRHAGDWILAILLGVPTLAAAISGWGPMAGPGDWLNWLGRVAGVAGLACLLVATIVSVRIPGLDKPFGGLSRLWHQHHTLGLAAFLLLLAHPLLMALSVAPLSLAATTGVLLPPPADWPMWLGWVALLAMMIFLAPSFQFLGRPEYQRWKLMHFLAGVAVVGGLIHTLPLTRTLSPGAAAVIWGGLGLLAVAVFVWRATIARPLMRREWMVVENRKLADRVVEIVLEPPAGHEFSFAPGQFVYFTPRDDSLTAGRNEEHPYTIVSAPHQTRLCLAVKDLGDASGALQHLRADTPAAVEGPYGDFFPRRLRPRPQLWIGGGIGITPFVSAARAIDGGTPWGDTVLINCANDPERAYYLPELEAIAERRTGLQALSHYFVDEGPLTTAFITRVCSDAATREWFVCGPAILVALARGAARELGVPMSRFHAEEFNFL